MKKVLTIFAGLVMTVPALATDPEPNPYPADTVVSASYVKGAYDAVMNVVGTMSDLGDTTANANTNFAATDDTLVEAINVLDADLGKVTTANMGATSATTVVGAIAEVNTALTGKQATLSSTNVVLDSNNSSGAVVTGVSASGGTVTVSKGEVTIPVGAASGQNVTSYAQIWIQ